MNENDSSKDGFPSKQVLESGGGVIRLVGAEFTYHGD